MPNFCWDHDPGKRGSCVFSVKATRCFGLTSPIATGPIATSPHLPSMYMRCWPNVVLMLGQRRRRWTNIKSTLDLGSSRLVCWAGIHIAGNVMRWPSSTSVLGYRLGHWPNSETMLDRSLVSTLEATAMMS